MLVALGVGAAGAPAQASELVVRVTGIRSAGGEIGCALHADAAQFLKASEATAGRRMKADPNGVTCRFTGIATGSYAVAVLHDLNGNRKTDTNALGMPTEDWGVSNNVRPTFRAPTFDEARVAVPSSGQVTVTVRISR